MITRMRDALARASDISKVFRAFGRDRKGTGAIEFAILAPILIMAYIGAFEVSVGFNVSRKVARASSTVADIVTQQTEVNKEFLDGMKDVAASVMSPFGGTYSLKITGIEVTSVGNGKVIWSRDEKGTTPYKAGEGVAIPKELSALNTFVVRTEMVVPHGLLLFAPDLTSKAQTINLSKTYYYRQRIGEKITCDDCNS